MSENLTGPLIVSNNLDEIAIAGSAAQAAARISLDVPSTGEVNAQVAAEAAAREAGDAINATAALNAQTTANEALSFGAAALPTAGGTMTGELVLDGGPVNPLDATTKAYTDAGDAANAASAAAAQTTASAALPRTGGTMTGAIILVGDPAAPLQPATQQYVDAETLARIAADAVNAAAAAAAQATANAALPLTGGTMTGAAGLAGGSTAATPATIDNSTLIATTAFVQAALSGIVAGLRYQGTWNASTNTPTLASGVGTQNFFYLVSVAGSTTLDGISSWAVADQAIFNGTVWTKQAASALYAPLANPTFTTGINTPKLTYTLSADVVSYNPSVPTFVDYVTDSQGNIIFGFDYTGQTWTLSLKATGTLTVTGASSLQAVTMTAALATTLAASVSVAAPSVQASNNFTLTATGDIWKSGVAIPFFIDTVTDASGNILSGYDTSGNWHALTIYATGLIISGVVAFAAVTATTVATTGAMTAAGGFALPSGDAFQPQTGIVPQFVHVDVDAVGNLLFGIDSQGNYVFQNLTILGTLTVPNNGTTSTAPNDTLDITSTPYGGVGDGFDDVFSGTWSNGGSTLTLGKFSGTVSWPLGSKVMTVTYATADGPGFDPDVTGQHLYVQSTDGTNVAVTVLITGWTAQTSIAVDTPSPANITSAILVWPAFTAGDVNKAIRVEGATASATQQVYRAGIQAYGGYIASVIAGNQVTVIGKINAIGTILSTFTTDAAGAPVRVTWGTDNTNAYVLIGAAALAQGKKYIWHPSYAGRARTTYCAFSMAQRRAFDTNMFFFFNGDPFTSIVGAVWIGDGSVRGVHTDISAYLIPKRIVPVRSEPYLPPARNLTARIQAPRTIAAANPSVIEVGDSLAKYDPTLQSDAWFEVNWFERRLIEDNPSKTPVFTNVANTGTDWAFLVDPANVPSWLISGTDLFWLGEGGNNDAWRGHPIKIQSAINLVRALPADAHGNPPDIFMTDENMKPDAKGAAGPVGIWQSRMHMQMLQRSMAKFQKFGFVDLETTCTEMMYGWDSMHREFRELPPATVNVSPATPFVWNVETWNYSLQAQITAASGAAAWTAMGQFIVNLSPFPGNVLILDRDPGTGNLRYETRLWGNSAPTTVSTSGSTLTTAAGTPFAGTLTWTTGTNNLNITDGVTGPFTGTQGQCLLMPGVDEGGQTQRTFIDQVVDAENATVDDFCWNLLAAVTPQIVVIPLTASIGGVQFTAADAVAGIDVIMTWAGNEYRGKVAGFTDPNTVTLSPPPPALTNQAVTLWIGKISVPKTVSTQPAGNSANPVLRISLNNYMLSISWNSATVHTFRGIIERFGNPFYPRVETTATGPATIAFTQLFSDRDVNYMPPGTEYDIWGTLDAHFSGGGSGGHPPSLIAERVTRRVFEAQDFVAS